MFYSKSIDNSKEVKEKTKSQYFYSKSINIPNSSILQSGSTHKELAYFNSMATRGKEIISADRDVYDRTETHNNNVIDHNKKRLVVTSDTAYNNNNNNKNGIINGSVSEKEEAAIWVPKFMIGLTNKEKEEDFLVFKGTKLPPKPKRRAKFMQRTINVVSPGTRLSKLCVERYEVREKKISKKKARGLKAMCNMESESESE